MKYAPLYIDTVPNRQSRPSVRHSLKGEALVSADELFAVERSLPHGHVQAVLGTVRRPGLDTLIASRPCRERDLVVALEGYDEKAPGLGSSFGPSAYPNNP